MSIKINKRPEETLYIYCRVSTTHQSDEGVSLDVQEERGLKLSKRLNLKPVVIKEQGSGLQPYIPHTNEKGKKRGRPLFTEIMDEIEDDGIKNMWIDEDTRLTRFDQDQQYIHILMKKKGVNLFVGTSTTPKKWDWITDLVDTIITKVNQNQIRTQVRKSNRSKRKLFSEGCYMKGDPPYGYKLVDKKLEIDDEQVEWVRKMFNWYDIGKSTVFIQKQLFQGGQKPPRSKRELFPLTSIQRMLKNKNYIGIDVYNDLTNECPIIIDKKIFDSVQKKFPTKSSRSIETKHDFLLRGIIKCPDGQDMGCLGKKKS